MAASPPKRPPPLPRALVLFALYFAVFEGGVIYLMWRAGPMKTIPSFVASVFRGSESAWLFFWPAFLELTLFALLVVGVLLVVVALLRKRMFSRVLIAWLQLNLLFVLQGLMGKGWDTVIAYGILLGITAVSAVGIIYAQRSPAVAAYFSR